MKWVPPPYLGQFVAAFMLSCWWLAWLCWWAVKALCPALDGVLWCPALSDQQGQGDQELLRFILKVFIQSICQFKKKKINDICCITTVGWPHSLFQLHLKWEWAIGNGSLCQNGCIPHKTHHSPLQHHKRTFLISSCCHCKQRTFFFSLSRRQKVSWALVGEVWWQNDLALLLSSDRWNKKPQYIIK